MKPALRFCLVLMYLLGLGTYLTPVELYGACCVTGDEKSKCCGDCCWAGATQCGAEACSGS